MRAISALVLLAVFAATDAVRVGPITMGPRLHGSPQSRSPLVNWGAAELGVELEMAPPRPSNHPFGQIPFLVDDGGVEVFESGAILLYLSDTYGEKVRRSIAIASRRWSS